MGYLIAWRNSDVKLKDGRTIHHLFPREHLKKAGMTRALPDQIAALAAAFENFLAAYDREQTSATLNVKRLMPTITASVSLTVAGPRSAMRR